MQSHRNQELDLALAVRQIAARQRIRTKVPTFYQVETLMYPVQLSVEQSSSELTALHKASMVKGKRLVDLTGGLGVDFYFMAQQFEESIYVERQESLCELAEWNFKQLGLTNFSIENTDTEDYIQIMPETDVVYIDPHRRSESGRKTVFISDCEPDLTSIIDILLNKTKTVLVKLSPMLDIHKAISDLPCVSQVDIVAVDNECKEILLKLEKNRNNENPTTVRSFNYLKNNSIQKYFSQSIKDTDIVEYTSQAEKFLYEPNSAVMKSGGFNRIATDFKLKKFHPNTHLYTSSELRQEFPGRVFQVESVHDFSKHTINILKNEYGSAHISVRNFPMSVDELRKKTKLKDGGELYLFAFTTGNNHHILTICKKIIF